MSPSEFFVVRLTALGRGAVATVLADGQRAIAAVAKHFMPRGRISLLDCPPDRLLIGRFGPAGEEVVVHRQDVNSVAIHCHGGLAAAQMVVELLCAEGGRPIPWEQWLLQCHSPMCYWQKWRAEAQIALAQARTERTAAILLDQMNGALERELAEAQASIAEGQPTAAAQRLVALVRRYRIGRHLVQPWRVALAGPVNAGKSSLLNALAGYNRAIVHPMPGSTRDALTTDTAFDGWPMQLCDTAGLRPTDDQIERAGIQRAWQVVAAADLVIWVFDLSIPWAEQLSAIAGSLDVIDESLRGCVAPLLDGISSLVPQAAAILPGRPAAVHSPPSAKPALCVYNKADLEQCYQPPETGITTSAFGGAGLGALADAIVVALVGDPPPPGAAIPFTEEQKTHIERLLVSLGDLREVVRIDCENG